MIGTGLTEPQRMDARWSFQLVSAIPGRLRVRCERVRPGAIARLAESVAAAAGGIEATPVPDALSIVVRYNPLHAAPDQVARLVTDTLGSAGGVPIGSAAPRMMVPASAPRTVAPRRAGSRQRSSPRQPARPSGGASGAAARIQAPPLLLPTVAVALAAVEAAPVLLVAGALAAAAAPKARRATESARAGQFVADQLDVANIALLAVRQQFLAASGVAWLLALSQLIQDRSRQRVADALTRYAGPHAGPDWAARHADAFHAGPRTSREESGPLSNTLSQTATADGLATLTVPMGALAAATFAVTGDASDLIGVAKPRAEVASSLRAMGPITVAAVLAAMAERGVVVRDAAALERLAKLPAMPAAARRRTRPLRLAGSNRLVPAEDDPEVILVSGNPADAAMAVRMARNGLRLLRGNRRIAMAGGLFNLLTALTRTSPSPMSTAVMAGVTAVTASRALAALPAGSRA